METEKIWQSILFLGIVASLRRSGINGNRLEGDGTCDKYNSRFSSEKWN